MQSHQSATSFASRKQKALMAQHGEESDGDEEDEQSGSIQDACNRANANIADYSQRKLAKQNIVFSHPPKGLYESDLMFDGLPVSKIKELSVKIDLELSNDEPSNDYAEYIREGTGVKCRSPKN